MKSQSLACLLLLWTTASGCYHFRAAPAELAPATGPRRETVWVLAWGLIQQEVRPDDCQGNGMAEVRVQTNLGFNLLTLLTLGFAAPATVEWTCAKDPTGGGGDEF